MITTCIRRISYYRAANISYHAVVELGFGILVHRSTTFGSSEPSALPGRKDTISPGQISQSEHGTREFLIVWPPVAAILGKPGTTPGALGSVWSCPTASRDGPFVFLTERGLLPPSISSRVGPTSPLSSLTVVCWHEEGARSAHSFLFLVAHLTPFFANSVQEFYYFCSTQSHIFPHHLGAFQISIVCPVGRYN